MPIDLGQILQLLTNFQGGGFQGGQGGQFGGNSIFGNNFQNALGGGGFSDRFRGLPGFGGGLGGGRFPFPKQPDIRAPLPINPQPIFGRPVQPSPQPIPRLDPPASIAPPRGFEPQPLPGLPGFPVRGAPVFPGVGIGGQPLPQQPTPFPPISANPNLPGAFRPIPGFPGRGIGGQPLPQQPTPRPLGMDIPSIFPVQPGSFNPIPSQGLSPLGSVTPSIPAVNALPGKRRSFKGLNALGQ